MMSDWQHVLDLSGTSISGRIVAQGLLNINFPQLDAASSTAVENSFNTVSNSHDSLYLVDHHASPMSGSSHTFSCTYVTIMIRWPSSLKKACKFLTSTHNQSIIYPWKSSLKSENLTTGEPGV
jgi:hypothetical protein